MARGALITRHVVRALGLALLSACDPPGGAAQIGAPDAASDSTTMVPADAAPDSVGPLTGEAGDGMDAADAASLCPVIAADSGAPVPTAGMSNLVPMPVSVTPTGGAFVLSPTAAILVEPGSTEMLAVAGYLAAKLRPATGFPLPVMPASGLPLCGGNIVLTTDGADATLGSEGYDLSITPDRVLLSAPQPAGIFRGLQTLRQLLPPAIESATESAGPWGIATGTIHDYPRFAWRGTMLDVARHFFGVADVEAYLDLLAYYKVNVFHLHLTDDQGWRIAINTWPNLAVYGGSTEVDGGAGGYYSQADYAAIALYAGARYITVVPEIDMPGHTNAALASYASLNCNGVAPPLDTATTVGVSSLCISDSATYTFASDVIREVAALTPGPYYHVGGDEASMTSAADFQTFFAQITPLVQTAGKFMVGWDAVGQITKLPPGSVVQYWAAGDAAFVTDGINQNAKVLMSPASKAYLDMKYDAATPVGQIWAGYIDEETAYSWDPAAILTGVTDAQIVGLEAPLWTELLVTLADLEYMAFPRIAGYAEIGWSTAGGRSWDEYKTRIGSQGPRLRALGVNYYVSSRVPWQ
jgi:hexosaminidase